MKLKWSTLCEWIGLRRSIISLGLPQVCNVNAIWWEGGTGKMGSGDSWMPRCSVILTTLLCSHLNVNEEQVTLSVWLEGTRGDGGYLGRSVGRKCATGSTPEVVAADWRTWYSIPLDVWMLWSMPMNLRVLRDIKMTLPTTFRWFIL